MTTGETGQGSAQPGVLATQPVLAAGTIATAFQAAIVAIITMLASFGWITVNPEQMGAVERMLAAVSALLVLIVPQAVALFWARRQVTPLAAPRTEAGVPAVLLPVAQAQAMGILPQEDGGEDDDPERDPLPPHEPGRSLR